MAEAADPSAGGVEDLEQRLLSAAVAGDAIAVQEALKAGAEPACETDDGVTPLMASAAAGSVAAVQALLEAGAPWHAQDREGNTAGEYASGGGHRDVVRLLVDWGVKAELLLGTISRRERSAAAASAAAASNRDYLNSSIRYDEDGKKLMDEQGEAVMMAWETPLMERHAALICGGGAGGGDVLNVGFGLGIIDSAIQQHKPRSHTIIEAHPEVFRYAQAQGWGARLGVCLILGRWQDVIQDLGPFDGIFFDTYGEYYEDMHDFHLHLPRLLRRGGVYSFFNGLAPDNMFFHLVYCEVARRQLARLGLATSYAPLPQGDEARAPAVWAGVANRYWHLPVYFLPSCTFEEEDDDEEEAVAVGEGEAAAAKGVAGGSTPAT